MDNQEVIKRLERMKHHCDLCLSQVGEFECMKEECDKDNKAIQIAVNVLQNTNGGMNIVVGK